jgi:hypothetical protein
MFPPTSNATTVDTKRVQTDIVPEAIPIEAGSLEQHDKSTFTYSLALENVTDEIIHPTVERLSIEPVLQEVMAEVHDETTPIVAEIQHQENVNMTLEIDTHLDEVAAACTPNDKVKD